MKRKLTTLLIELPEDEARADEILSDIFNILDDASVGYSEAEHNFWEAPSE